jgi:L-malate glycosyltransferase
MREVVIIQRIVCEYRTVFFERLREALAPHDVRLRLISGFPRPGEDAFDLLDTLEFGERFPTTYLRGRACWIRGLRKATGQADLVVLPQENGALYTYPFLFRRLAGRRKPLVAYWGHGSYMGRPRGGSCRDLWKSFWVRHVDWWFAYTARTTRILESAHFPLDRITVVNNATDTSPLRKETDVRRKDSDATFEHLFGCERNRLSRVGVFCGRLIPSKWIGFLLDSVLKIREQLPEFYVTIIGDGPLEPDVSAFCKENTWCKWIGATWGTDRADYLAVADVWLNPGAVGLAVVDAFSVGLPLATTNNGMHGPEICYLEHGRTGLITAPDKDAYVAAIVALLKEDDRLAQAKAQAHEEGARYSVETMARLFASGIVSCLATRNGDQNVSLLERSAHE